MDKHTLFTQNPSCIKSKIRDEYFLLNLDSDKYLKLNTSAGFIWDYLKEPKSLTEIKRKLEQEFKISDDEFNDIESFLKECIEQKIVLLKQVKK